jgi:hypothetical protein
MPITYEPIATTTLSSPATNITFSAIPATYTDLKIVFSGTTSIAAYLGMQFNSDTSTNYSLTSLYANGSSIASFGANNTNYIYLSGIPTTSTTIPFFSEINLLSYANSTFKNVLTTFNMNKGNSGGIEKIVGSWRNTAAITSVRLLIGSDGSATFSTNSTATLYGIKNA